MWLEPLVNLLNECRDCFAFKLEGLDCTALVSTDIKQVPGGVPVVTRLYKPTPEEREEILRIVQEMETNGIFTDTTSPYACPVL